MMLVFLIVLTLLNSISAFNKAASFSKRMKSSLYVSVGGGGGPALPEKKTNNFIISPTQSITSYITLEIIYFSDKIILYG